MKTALDLEVTFPDTTAAFGHKIRNKENDIRIEVAVQVKAQSRVSSVNYEVLKTKLDLCKYINS